MTSLSKYGVLLTPKYGKKEDYAEFENFSNTLRGIMNLPLRQPQFIFVKNLKFGPVCTKQKMPSRRFGGVLYNLLLGDKLLCSLTTTLRRVISVSREHDQLKFLQARTIRKVRGMEGGGGWFLARKNFFLAVCLCKKSARIFRLILTLYRNFFRKICFMYYSRRYVWSASIWKNQHNVKIVNVLTRFLVGSQASFVLKFQGVAVYQSP